jgi:hypothetical protein
MIKPVSHTENYFQAPKNYFWQWAEGTNVIEWVDGLTICYRDALIGIMRDLSVKGLPPLGSLLLVLAACDKKRIVDEDALLNGIIYRFVDLSLKDRYEAAKKFLHIIRSLPEELRTGKNKIHLLQEVFGDSEFYISNIDAKEALDELDSGRSDEIISRNGNEVTTEQIMTDLKFIFDALQRFPSVEKLELKLRTGLVNIPKAAEILLPESSPVDLFDELSQDPKTAGIARLAKRLVAALNIPMHSTLDGDQSYGGITDITNRGSYDKLLLSELAYDNDLLVARLVNNEALYFRREQPPDNPKRQRTILVDTTIKMWGVPRAFAISSALAFAHSTKHNEIVEAYALGGNLYKEIRLDSKQGIVDSLEILDHALHCGKALHTVTNELPSTGYNEFIFITDEKTMNSPAFHSFFSETKEMLGFLLTVNREGEIHFYECKRGKIKLLNTARFDLEELLFAPVKFLSNTKKPTDTGIPAFILQMRSPLLFPKMRIKLTEGRLFYDDMIGLVVVNATQRVLHIPKTNSAAFELLNYIEKGSYAFGFTAPNDLYLMIRNFPGKRLKFYHIDLLTNITGSIDLSDEIQFVTDIGFRDDKFYLRAWQAEFVFDCKVREVTGQHPSGTFADNQFGFQKPNLAKFSEIRKFVEPFDSIMYRVKKIYISTEGKLVLGNYKLELVWSNRHLRILENITLQTAAYVCKEDDTVYSLVQNKEVKFKLWKWTDGSEVTIDSRGFLHLKSSDPSIPEITMVLVTGKNTACWAADGTVCGDLYFIHQDAFVMKAADFYEKYIQRFIDKVIRS